MKTSLFANGVLLVAMAAMPACGSQDKIGKSKPAQALGLTNGTSAGSSTSSADGEKADDVQLPVAEQSKPEATDAADAARVKIDAKTASTKALALVPGGTVPTDATAENVDGAMLYIVEVHSGSKVTRVSVNAETGVATILASDSSQNGGDGEHQDRGTENNQTGDHAD